MEEINFNEFRGKTLRIIMNSNYTYICQIISWGDRLLRIKDKYEKIVFLSIPEIKVLEVLNNNE